MSPEEKAFSIFAGVLEANSAAVARHFQRHEKRQFDFDRLASASEYRKMKLGARLIRRYRDETGATGPINWDDFKQWCKDHWKAIVAVKIILTVLLLFCL